ncbi:TOMM precursor leader peptide-binding protein [Streptomyces sp. NPDC020330]|uniref:TOMM precursor leader peptide-binding protein n=1 Tax=unclassified Streptomyces TaxID=2593676 RepID=UPI0037AF10CC
MPPPARETSPDRPRPEAARVGFKRHLRVEAVPGEAVYLLSEGGTTVLHGTAAQVLAPLLDGSRSLPELLASAADRMDPVEAGEALAELGEAGLVGLRDPAVPPAEAHAYWDAAGLDGPVAAARVADARVYVEAAGRADAAAARAACLQAGTGLCDSPGDADITLVVCGDYLDPGLTDASERHARTGLPWLPVRVAGGEVWVGPVFAPAEADRPCWHCLAHRLRGHRTSQEPVRRALRLPGGIPLPPSALPATRAIGFHTAAVEAAKWAAGLRTSPAVWRLDTRTLATGLHPVTRRPQCSGCGVPGLVAARALLPVVLESRPRCHAEGGGHRAVAPAVVWARHRGLVGPVTGVVAEVREAPGTPDGLHHYVSGRNLALAGHDLANVRAGLRSHSGGKGTTPEEARLGALCEAVERYSATRQGDEAVVRETLRGLGDAALHPNASQLYADRQFREREAWNARHAGAPFQLVPPPFDPRSVAEWTPLWSLGSRRTRYLPTSMLYFGPGPDGRTRAPWADSNGNAAGSSLEDAVLQGLLEVVERDAVALWWYHRTRQPGVDLDAFDEPWLADARAAYARSGREVWALDLTADLGVPVVAAVSRRTGRPADELGEGLALGFGAHTDPRVAVRRAVTELGQLLPPDTAAGLRACAEGDADLCAWWTGATLAEQPYLAPDPAERARTAAAWDVVAHDDLREEVRAVERLLAARGLETLVLDQTRPDIGLPVVKVVVPGMRHFWARFAPGRLFDVPVELGRVARKPTVEELNPVPLFV